MRHDDDDDNTENIREKKRDLKKEEKFNKTAGVRIPLTLVRLT